MLAVKDRLCIALDGSDRDWIVDMGRRVAPEVGWLKVGLEAFAAHGPALVEEIVDCGARVFLDLKLHDIPNTVRAASRNCAAAGVSLLTVHTGGGRLMMEAAVEGARLGRATSRVVGVTVLTSLDDAALAEVGFDATAAKLVPRLAGLAQSAGLDGVVCSPHEAGRVRSECGGDFFVVTPGIRAAGAETGDQRRVMTPRQAVDNGADLLVVGRPVTRADDPVGAIRGIVADIEG